MVRVVLVEDNRLFRQTMELLLGLRAEIEVVGSVAGGAEAVEVCARLTPDVALLDYRMPGLDGAQTTRALLEASPAIRVICLSASVSEDERRLVLAAGAASCLTKDEGLERIVEAILAAGERHGPVNLTAANTAIVLDSTADFPEAVERFPNWRVVPLYVNFGGTSYRDYVDLGPAELYERLASAPEPPTTSQPTPGDFLAVYEELLPQYERIYSLQLSSTLSGTYASAVAAAAQAGDAVRVIDTRTVCAAVAMLGLAVQRRLERGTTDEEIEALVERYAGSHGLLFTVDTLEYLARGGRIGRGAAFAGTLLNVKPVLGISEGEVVPLKRVRGSQKALDELVERLVESSVDGPTLRIGVAHAAAPDRLATLERMVREARPQAQLDLAASIGAVVGTHAGPGTVGLFWFDDAG